MAEGLPVVPRKQIDYRGKVFEEMDTAAVIARKPEWALVDELAHTNVPGTVHEKRWQSVDEILAAGINVISTVNVQHFESLNDTVFEITSVRVRETLPDSILDRADEVVLVDLTADALINRLNRGVVYDLDKIPGALSNFFRRGNLVALRELALRKTAEEVDEKPAGLHRRARDRDALGHRGPRGRVRQGRVRWPRSSCAAATAWPSACRASSGSCTCTRRGRRSGRHHDELAELFELARNLGGSVVELSRRLRGRRHPRLRSRAPGDVHRHGRSRGARACRRSCGARR